MDMGSVGQTAGLDPRTGHDEDPRRRRCPMNAGDRRYVSLSSRVESVIGTEDDGRANIYELQHLTQALILKLVVFFNGPPEALAVPLQTPARLDKSNSTLREIGTSRNNGWRYRCPEDGA